MHYTARPGGRHHATEAALRAAGSGGSVCGAGRRTGPGQTRGVQTPDAPPSPSSPSTLPPTSSAWGCSRALSPPGPPSRMPRRCGRGGDAGFSQPLVWAQSHRAARAGLVSDELVKRITDEDQGRDTGQVAVIDAKGRSAVYTGKRVIDRNSDPADLVHLGGYAGHVTGKSATCRARRPRVSCWCRRAWSTWTSSRETLAIGPTSDESWPQRPRTTWRSACTRSPGCSARAVSIARLCVITNRRSGFTRASAADPHNTSLRAEAASDHSALGTTEAKPPQRTSALASHFFAVTTSRELSKANAGNVELRVAVALGLTGRGDSYAGSRAAVRAGPPDRTT